MKKITILFFVVAINLSSAQKNTTQISVNGGVSMPTGVYSEINFDGASIENGQYPFSGGMGAQSGYSGGISTSYFFSKYFGISCDWNYLVHSIISEPRSQSFSSYWPDDFESYEATINGGWSHNTLNFGTHVALPFAKDKCAIDFKSMIGFSAFRTPSIAERVVFTDGSSCNFMLDDANFTSLSTKFELGFKFFIKDFGIGLYVNTLSVYSSNSDNSVDVSITDYNSYESTSRYWVQFNPSMLNYGFNLTYRIR